MGSRVTNLMWEEPPPIKYQHKGRKNPRLDAMKAHPGKWLLYDEDISRSIQTRLRKEGFEAASRTIPGKPGRVRLYARWPEDAQ